MNRPQKVSPPRSSQDSVAAFHQPRASKNQSAVTLSSPLSTGTRSSVWPARCGRRRSAGKSTSRQICVWKPVLTFPMSCRAAKRASRAAVASPRVSNPPDRASRCRMDGWASSASKQAPTSAMWCSSRCMRRGSSRSDFAQWNRVYVGALSLFVMSSSPVNLFGVPRLKLSLRRGRSYRDTDGGNRPRAYRHGESHGQPDIQCYRR